MVGGVKEVEGLLAHTREWEWQGEELDLVPHVRVKVPDYVDHLGSHQEYFHPCLIGGCVSQRGVHSLLDALFWGLAFPAPRFCPAVIIRVRLDTNSCLLHHVKDIDIM